MKSKILVLLIIENRLLIQLTTLMPPCRVASPLIPGSEVYFYISI